METKEILKTICTEKGISGRENELYDTMTELFDGIARIRKKPNGTIIAEIGDNSSEYHIMFDAHIDRIGLSVTYIDDNGFIKAEPVGGIDLRALPTSAVIIKSTSKLKTTMQNSDGTFGTYNAETNEDIMGIVCAMPPHLTKKEEGLSRDNIWIDTGLSADVVKGMVNLGDSVIVKSEFREMLNHMVTVSALDNRAGCAALIKCAELLQGKDLPCRVSLVFSSQEETNESGAKTAAFELSPDEAIVVDVGFAKQEGVPNEKSGAIGCGPIISIAPVLSKVISDTLTEIAGELNIKCDYEVDGGGTGTNADGIAVSKGGVPCGVLSIPEKNMHTQTETVSIDDIDSVAKILVEYALRGGIRNA